MRHLQIFAILLSALCLSPGILTAAPNLPEGITLHETEKGSVLADSKGMTLYTYDKDEPGKSNCYENCIDKWPVLKATQGSVAIGSFSVVVRSDGAGQWAYQGHPLYYSHKDLAPGDVLGDGIRDIWHIVRP